MDEKEGIWILTHLRWVTSQVTGSRLWVTNTFMVTTPHLFMVTIMVTNELSLVTWSIMREAKVVEGCPLSSCEHSKWLNH
jgi:hypothetical protein